VPPLRIPVHYDFASTICYVAHRVMERMTPTLEELELELCWTPLDLAALCGYPRGAEVPEARRANALRVAEELRVPLRAPGLWLDSREAAAAAIAAEPTRGEASWRERVFSAVFEEGRGDLDADTVRSLAGDLGRDLTGADLTSGREELQRRTEQAARAQVTGVPTFMLGSWPFGGIQQEDTMRHILTRYSRKARAGQLS
jgi:predicted DsbA family dithiol-disulfide isomerase